MELDFWEQCWKQNQIAFYLPAVNPCLIKYRPLFNSRYNFELLHESEVMEEQQKYKEKGLNYLIERVYRILIYCK